MAKKSVPKKKSVKKTTSSKSSGGTEKILVENFVSLQKVITNLSVKFDELSKQISKLLDLFELSARTLTKKDLNLTGDNERKELMKKIDNLLDQNKTIARGLTLLYEENIGESQQKPALQRPQPPQQMPRQNTPPPAQTNSGQATNEIREGGYQKSISARDNPRSNG